MVLEAVPSIPSAPVTKELAAQTAQSLQDAKTLAAAALPGLVTRLTEMAMVDADPETVRKSVETVLKVAAPDKQETSSNRQVVNIVFQAGGLVQAQTVEKPIELVEEVVPEAPPPALPARLATPEPNPADELAALLGAVNSALV